MNPSESLRSISKRLESAFRNYMGIIILLGIISAIIAIGSWIEGIKMPLSWNLLLESHLAAVTVNTIITLIAIYWGYTQKREIQKTKDDWANDIKKKDKSWQTLYDDRVQKLETTITTTRNQKNQHEEEIKTLQNKLAETDEEISELKQKAHQAEIYLQDDKILQSKLGKALERAENEKKRANDAESKGMELEAQLAKAKEDLARKAEMRLIIRPLYQAFDEYSNFSPNDRIPERGLPFLLALDRIDPNSAWHRSLGVEAVPYALYIMKVGCEYAQPELQDLIKRLFERNMLNTMTEQESIIPLTSA